MRYEIAGVPSKVMRFEIARNERVLVVGRTRSGKTTLARALVRDLPGYVWLDFKAQMTTDDLPGAVTRVWPTTVPPGRAIIRFSPDPRHGDVAAQFDQVCFEALNAGNKLLIIDDANMVTSMNSIPHWYKQMLTIGASRGVGCWSIIQDPVGVHNALLSQSEHRFIFRVAVRSHRLKLAGVIGDEIDGLVTSLIRYEFVYHHDGMTTPVRCAPLSV